MVIANPIKPSNIPTIKAKRINPPQTSIALLLFITALTLLLTAVIKSTCRSNNIGSVKVLIAKSNTEKKAPTNVPVSKKGSHSEGEEAN